MAEEETGHEGTTLCRAASRASGESQKALPGKRWLQEEGQLEPSILAQRKVSNIRGASILWPCTYNFLVRGGAEPGLPRAFLRGPNLVPRGRDIPCVLCSHGHLSFAAVSRLVSASTNLLASSSIPGQGRQPAPILLGPCHSVPFADRWLGAVSSEASLCSP